MGAISPRSSRCVVRPAGDKGEKRKPTFKPSGMEQETTPDAPAPGETGAEGAGGPPKKRPGSRKRRKTQQLTIHRSNWVSGGWTSRWVRSMRS